MLRKELERLRFQLQESQDERGLPAGGKMQKGSVPLHLLHKNKFLLDWSFRGCVGRLVIPELLLLFWYGAAMGGKKGVMDGEEDGSGRKEALPTPALVMVTCGLGTWE